MKQSISLSGTTALPASFWRWVSIVLSLLSLAPCSSGQGTRPSGTVVTWGERVLPYVEPGARFTAIGAGAAHTVALTSDGAVAAWGSNTEGQAAVPVAAQSGAVAIAPGWHNTVALKSDGSAVAWGDNGYGKSTVPVEAQSGVTAIAAGDSHTVALKSDGAVVTWDTTVSARRRCPSRLRAE